MHRFGDRRGSALLVVSHGREARSIVDYLTQAHFMAAARDAFTHCGTRDLSNGESSLGVRVACH
jgi:hypothetical protein